MKITVVRKMEYKKVYIYVLQFEYVFMYLFPKNGEVFMQNIVATPSLWRRILWRLGALRTPYTEEVSKNCEEILLSSAAKSIDQLIENGILSSGKIPDVEQMRNIPSHK